MNVVRERLANQYLTVPGLKTAGAVVRPMGAVQAQDYAGAKWALSQRARDASDAEIERELTEGCILRTHVLRPTWHFVAPEDIRWMLALTAPRVSAAMAYYNRQLELTPAVFRRSRAALAKTLSGGKHLTRTELRAVLERARIGKISGQRLGHLMMQSELDAVVCSGARRGKQFTYALLDERVPPAPPLERDQALLELTRRYFSTRGPASAHDFAWWSGLTIADVKRGIQIAGRELELLELGEKRYWFTPRTRSAPKESPTAHLLPNYDEYFIGFKDRGAIGQRLGDLKLITGGDALIAHIVFVDGQIVGGWKRTFDNQTVTVHLDLLTTLSGQERKRVAAAADKFGTFLGQPCQIAQELSASRS
ncbi:MAG: winged helix DNA-binding domain-containing protein [Gemmatimonadaceae bacterium]